MDGTVKELPFYIREKVALDETSCEEELIVLAEDYEPQIRLEVARNPASSANVLSRFYDEKEKQVISALIKREELPETILAGITSYLFRTIDTLTLEGLSEDELILDAYLCSNSVAHSKATDENILKASKHKFTLVRLGAICNPNLTSETIFNMLKEETVSVVVESLLKHQNATPAVSRFFEEIDAYADDLPDDYVRQIILMSLPKLKK